MAKKQNIKPASRIEAEKAENLPINTVDAPEARFQDTQQKASMAETTATAQVEPFIKKKVKSAGHTLRQEVAAQVLTGKGIGGTIASGATPATFGLKEISFSGDTGTLLGNASGTPSMGSPFQGNTRIDKRLSDANKDINFNASEQIMVEYDNIPPLAASESTVGYNGNPKNVAARSQKKTGYTPAEMLYDRSLDFIQKDGFVFSSGQVVKQDGVKYADYPTTTYDNDLNKSDFEQVRGNYSPREIEVKVKKNATGSVFVSSFKVLEDDMSTNSEGDVIVNQSATNHIIDMNRAELSRQIIDAEAGSPTSEHFNPLGRSVEEPTATMAYLQDIENVMGAEIFASYKFANKARAHFLSRTAKDGQDLTGPAIDALYGHLAGATDLEDLKTALENMDTVMGYQTMGDTLFSKAGMSYGSAALMIPLFDSLTKYKTKGDLVNQPRGLKMHLQTADNNMDVFRCKDEFVAALNSIDAYSTIDHEYDPTSPVYILDNVRLIHPYSWEAALSFTRKGPGAREYSSKPLRYYYNAGSGNNSYLITVGEPVLNGIAYFLEMHAPEIWSALKQSSSTTEGEVTLHIPVVHSTTHFSLWDLLVCAATPYIIYERTNALKDILDFEMFYKYPFQGNVKIKDANPLDAVNYGTLSPYAQVNVKQMLPSSAIRWKYPEVFLRVGDGLMLPYYFNERAYTINGTFSGGSGADNSADSVTSTLTPNYSAEFTTPVVRSGVKLGVLDDFFGMEVKDQLLITDRLTRIPGAKYDDSVAGWIYKYDQTSDGIPVISDEFASERTALDYCSTPRLLGWYMDAPAGVCRVYDYDEDVAVVGTLAALDNISLSSMRPSYRAVQYKGIYGANDAIINRPLQIGSVNVNRAQAFTQVWGMKFAGYDRQSKYFDLILSINDAIEYNNENLTAPRFVTLNDKAQFSPYVYGPYAIKVQGTERYSTNTAYRLKEEERPILFSPHFMLWTLLQKLPFVVNPFENSDNNKPAADPFGVAYLFGLSGFMSANYDEEIYNRANNAQNLGYGYTSDPMVAASPIFKDAFKYTNIG